MAIKELFKQCCSLFNGSVVTKQKILQANKLLANITANDVALDNLERFKYLDYAVCQRIAGSDHFSLDIFILPENFAMPLHDHPGMTVSSKMLIGKAKYLGYDWEDDKVSFPRKAKLTTYGTFDKNSYITSLHACEGNLHTILSVSSCAFLDILIPPYKPGERDCTYYIPVNNENDYQFNFDNPPKEVLLEAYDAPNFACYSKNYEGPSVE